MEMYRTLMTAYGVSAGINFKFGGLVANTLNAHRVIQHFQEEKGPETADKIIACTLHKPNARSQTDGDQRYIHNTLRTSGIHLPMKLYFKQLRMQGYRNQKPKHL
jgi:hypothetical protein